MLEPLVARLLVDSSGTVEILLLDMLARRIQWYSAPSCSNAFVGNPVVQFTLLLKGFWRNPLVQFTLLFTCFLGEIWWYTWPSSSKASVGKPLVAVYPFCKGFWGNFGVTVYPLIGWPGALVLRWGNTEKSVIVRKKRLASLRVGALHSQPCKPTMCCYCQAVSGRMPIPALVSASFLSLQYSDATLAPESFIF